MVMLMNINNFAHALRTPSLIQFLHSPAIIAGLAFFQPAMGLHCLATPALIIACSVVPPIHICGDHKQ